MQEDMNPERFDLRTQSPQLLTASLVDTDTDPNLDINKFVDPNTTVLNTLKKELNIEDDKNKKKKPEEQGGGDGFNLKNLLSKSLNFIFVVLNASLATYVDILLSSYQYNANDVLPTPTTVNTTLGGRLGL